MFTSTCTECGKNELIFPTQMTGLVHTAHGFTVGYTCWCGAAQTWHVEREDAPQVAVAA